MNSQLLDQNKGDIAATDFIDHGLPEPYGYTRGSAAAVDGDGRKIVLCWLTDRRGCYEVLLIDAQTGKTEDYPIPCNLETECACPFTMLYSSKGLLYTHFDCHFFEFDPKRREYTFVSETMPRIGMSMTESDDGTIWAATYPDSGLVSYNPDTREFRDYGSVYEQNWMQYPRHLATDNAGWVYLGIGKGGSQIVAYNPETDESYPLLDESERVKTHAFVFSGIDGKVYGGPDESGGWESARSFYEGKEQERAPALIADKKPIRTGCQGFFHREFPDGSHVEELDFRKRKLVIADPAKGTRNEIEFEYNTEGTHLMCVEADPAGRIYGIGGESARILRPGSTLDESEEIKLSGQWNAIGWQRNRFYICTYMYGRLLEWDPDQPHVFSREIGEEGNPKVICECQHVINRPHFLLPHPDGRTVIVGGTPGYGYTGGGLLFWDCENGTQTLIEHTDILPLHSTMSMVALPEGKLLGGSTITAGTGGEVKAKEAELYIMDMQSKTVEQHDALVPELKEYTKLCLGADGIVYAVADRNRFLVIDINAWKVIIDIPLEEKFGPIEYQQAPRIFIRDDKGNIFMLFRKGIARINHADHSISWLADSPLPIILGGAYANGRIYYGSYSRLCSIAVS